MKNFGSVEKWLERRKLEKEEREELKRLQLEENRKRNIATLREHIERVNELIERENEKILKCREKVKELLKKRNKNDDVVIKRAQLCLLRMKAKDYFEQIAEIWDQAVEQMDIFSEFGSAFNLLRESTKLFDESVSAFETGDLSSLGIAMRRMNRVLEKVTGILDMHLKIPSIHMDSGEVKRFIEELSAETVAEEEEKLRPLSRDVHETKRTEEGLVDQPI